MPDCGALLEKAKRRPQGLSLDEACQLAECHGFVFDRQRGSHRMYKRPGVRQMLNFQPDRNGGAKAFQVRQLLMAIEELNSGEGAS